MSQRRCRVKSSTGDANRWNRAMWAAAISAVGKGAAYDLLHGLAEGEYGVTSLKELTDTQRKEICRRCGAMAAEYNLEPIAPGYATKDQRNAIAACRHALGWDWDRIRTMVRAYGAKDWRHLKTDDANNLIQRLNLIIKNTKAKRAAGA